MRVSDLISDWRLPVYIYRCPRLSSPDTRRERSLVCLTPSLTPSLTNTEKEGGGEERVREDPPVVPAPVLGVGGVVVTEGRYK